MLKRLSLRSIVLAPILIASFVLISYIALFYNDAQANLAFILNTYGYQPLWILNAVLLILIVPTSLKLMEVITGEFGLERFKRIAAISVGMTSLGFAALQFIGAIATSSAEGATVVVEIVQQIAHYTGHGELEQYGLVGMLTSDASGPWNASIFPLIILTVWLLRKKPVSIEAKQLHIPMTVQWILYAQQFLFGLDLQYTLFEIILMAITGTIFVWGMVTFLVSMFKEAESAEEQAAEYIKSSEKKVKRKNIYAKSIDYLARLSFRILTYNPINKKVNVADKQILNKKGGFGNISRTYVVMNAVQLTLAMTVAMFALVTSMQFFATQIRMSDAEAALFGTAGLTSAPEAFVALAAGPYINALLLVGSNIIDGWMSALGQIFLLSYAEIASNGAITAIPLHPAIRYLTFLSWTQGMLVWASLALYAHKIDQVKRKSLLQLTVICLLLISVLYYFGGAWFSAQAVGYGAEYALNSTVYLLLNKVVTLFASLPTQQVALSANIIGLVLLFVFWSGISEKIKKLIKSSSGQEIDSSILELKSKISSHLKREDQQVVIVLDTSRAMDKAGKLFKNKWIDLVFRQAAALGILLDDDAHIPVYTTRDGMFKKNTHLLTSKNADNYIEKYVGRVTSGKLEYAPVIDEIISEYKKSLTKEHDPVLVLFITAGGGTDTEATKKLMSKHEDTPIFVQFMEIYGEERHANAQKLSEIARYPGKTIDNYGLSSLPLYKTTDSLQVVADVLNKYPKYLEKAVQLGLISKNKE